MPTTPTSTQTGLLVDDSSDLSVRVHDRHIGLEGAAACRASRFRSARPTGAPRTERRRTGRKERATPVISDHSMSATVTGNRPGAARATEQAGAQPFRCAGIGMRCRHRTRRTALNNQQTRRDWIIEHRPQRSASPNCGSRRSWHEYVYRNRDPRRVSLRRYRKAAALRTHSRGSPISDVMLLRWIAEEPPTIGSPITSRTYRSMS